MNQMVYPAPARLRLLAAGINLLPYILITMYLSADRNTPVTVTDFVVVMALIGYPAVQLVLYLTKGQSIGKRILRLRVYTDHHGPAPFGRLLVRLLTGLLLTPFLLFYPGLLFPRNRKGAHDYLSGTYVGTLKAPGKISHEAKKRWALALDITFPLGIALAFFLFYWAGILLYLAASILTIGYLFLYIDDFALVLEWAAWILGGAAMLFYGGAQVYLVRKKQTTLGKKLLLGRDFSP
ncbi:putative RDD family membrane protein YckC [Paenibacillus mucilaginosus]|uniref:RDD family protein n=1 Tax=Paenibacillus mucilaginosus TaxID=61624 RepID=UPI003D1BF0D6